MVAAKGSDTHKYHNNSCTFEESTHYIQEDVLCNWTRQGPHHDSCIKLNKYVYLFVLQLFQILWYCCVYRSPITLLVLLLCLPITLTANIKYPRFTSNKHYYIIIYLLLFLFSWFIWLVVVFVNCSCSLRSSTVVHLGSFAWQTWPYEYLYSFIVYLTPTDVPQIIHPCLFVRIAVFLWV